MFLPVALFLGEETCLNSIGWIRPPTYFGVILYDQALIKFNGVSAALGISECNHSQV